MNPDLGSRIARLRSELDDHSRIARHLGLDLERPIRSLGDGYPQNAVSLVSRYTEKILGRLWEYHQLPGDPAGKTLSELIKRCSPYIRSNSVLDALREIERTGNRSARNDYVAIDEDGLAAVRCLLDVLVWFTDTGSDVLTGAVPQLTPLVAAKAEFLSGLYVTLGFSTAKRFELSELTVYQLFVRQVGLRSEYVEIILSRDMEEVTQVLSTTGGELLRTKYPKLTRFLVVDQAGSTPADYVDYRVVVFDRFLETIVDVEGHLSAMAVTYPVLDDDVLRQPIPADLLATAGPAAEMAVVRIGDASALLETAAAEGGNVLVVGRSGSGKTTLLKQLVAAGRDAAAPRYRFYLDLSLMHDDEGFAEFLGRTLAPIMHVDPGRAVDVFRYFVRSGSVVCALDAIDEAVREHSQHGFLELFAEVAEILSAESVVVMSSRSSFLEDSPQVRGLLDGGSLMSEQLVEHLHAEGVDPTTIPRFSVLRLRNLTQRAENVSPLEWRLSGELQMNGTLVDLLGAHIRRVLEDHDLVHLMPRLVSYFGNAALEGRRTFTLTDIWNVLGRDCFDGGQLSHSSLRLRPLLRPAGADEVAFTHNAYQEFLAANHLRDLAIRRPGQRITEQMRAFLHLLSGHGPARDDCVLDRGVYVVGPSHQLMMHVVANPVRFDRDVVTVARYNEFRVAVQRYGSAQWDHPDQPANIDHEPWRERLRFQDYYEDPAYADYPAICVSWWDAYAFARFAGRRLPTSLEWEAAARGTDGRLFPWGDELDLDAVNCADTWSGRPLVTYEAWRAEIDSGGLRSAFVQPVDAYPKNCSPIGVRQMVGNVWEHTSTVMAATGDVVICGGCFDNPARAVQVHSRGLFRPRGASNVVGFRCVEDI